MKRENRVPVLLNDQELEVVQDYRWRHRIKSQQEAVRILINKGLGAENKEADAAATASA